MMARYRYDIPLCRLCYECQGHLRMRWIMDKGQAMVEYAFIVALVILVVIVILTLFGSALGNMYQNFVNMF